MPICYFYNFKIPKNPHLYTKKNNCVPSHLQIPLQVFIIIFFFHLEVAGIYYNLSWYVNICIKKSPRTLKFNIYDIFFWSKYF